MRIIIVLCLLIGSADLFGQHDVLDSLQAELTQASSTESKVDILNRLSHAYSSLSITKSEQLAHEALGLAQPIGYGPGVATAYNNLGICFSIRGAYTEGIDYFMKALRLRETMSDQAMIANSLANIARVFGYQHDYDRALDYALQALEASRKTEDRTQIGMSYINVGNIYVSKKNLPLALTMFSTASDLLESPHPSAEQGWALMEIARVYDAMHNYQEALNTALRAQEMLKTQRDVFTAAELYQLIGTIYHHMSELKKGTGFLHRAISMADANDDSNGRISYRRALAGMYKDAGALDSALFYLEQTLVMNAEIFNTEKARQQAVLEKIYQTESKDQELREKNQQLRFQATVIAVISILLIVLIVLGYISYRYYRDKRDSALKLEKLNNEISAKHQEIVNQSEELARVNEEVRRINESLEQEVQHRSEKIRQQNEMLIEYAYFNAHNVRGPLARILGLAGLMERESSVELVREYNLKLHQSALELDTVVREINNKLQYGL